MTAPYDPGPVRRGMTGVGENVLAVRNRVQ